MSRKVFHVMRADPKLIKAWKMSKTCTEAKCEKRAKYIIVEKNFMDLSNGWKFDMWWQFCRRHAIKYLKENGIEEKRIKKVLERVS
jgi:hypothetical protein